MNKGQGSRVKIFLLLLITAHLSLITVFTGCAFLQTEKISALKKEAIDLNYAGVELSYNYETSAKRFEQALIVNKRIDNRKGIIINSINIARVYLGAERYDEALPFIQDAIKTAESERDNLLLSEAYATIIRYYYLKGLYSESIKYLETAIDIDVSSGLSIEDKLNLKALVYKDMGEPDKALAVLDDAVKRGQIKGRRAIADSCRIRGNILLSRERFEDAGQNFKKALFIDRELDRGVAIALDLSGLANLHIRKGEYKEALEYLKRAYDVNTANNKKNVTIDIDRIIETATLLKDDETVRIFSEKRKNLVIDKGVR